MRPIASWCVRHRRTVLLGWVVGVAVLAVAVSSAGSAYKNSFSLTGTQSYEAQQLLQKAAPKAAGDREQVVLGAVHGKITDPAEKARAERLLARVATLPRVAAVASPFTRAGAAQVSKSGTVAFADVTMTKLSDKFTPSEAEDFVNAVKAGAGGGLEVGVGGQVAEQSLTQSDSSVGFGALAALIVLLLVFGAVRAALLPLLTTGVALGAGVSLVGLLSHVITMANFSSQLSLLIGLGVGVDYALFIVTRHRQGLEAGKSVEDSIVDAIDTSGRAVMFAGITVCIALLGMFALGVSLLYGVAIAAAIVVTFTVLSALTLLPALLGFLGPKALNTKRRGRVAAGEYVTADSAGGGIWTRWTGAIQRRPVVLAVGAVVVMAVIAIPFFSMRLGSTDAAADPSGSTTRAAYELLAKGFGPGYNGPLQLVAKVDSAAQRTAFTQAVVDAAKAPGVASATPPVTLAGTAGGHSVAFSNLYPTGSPQAKSTGDLLTHLRDDVVPAATRGTGEQVLIGGQTAVFADFAHVLTNKLPLFIGIVVALSFLLLAAVFRSLVIPLMAAVMNGLSAGAAFGALTAVFQWGWLDSLLGIDQTGPIEAFIPVMLFAILFGLSMDYEVFLVSRIYEEWHHTRNNRLAVVRGVQTTGRTVAAAASIMFLVFAAFILGDNVTIKMFGLGLAAAVFLDALVVRLILVPSLMLLIGAANWRLPQALDRVLPRLNVEGTGTREDSVAPPPRSTGRVAEPVAS